MKTAGNPRNPLAERIGTLTLDVSDRVGAEAEMGTLGRVVKRIRDLPPLPFVAQKIVSLTQEEDPNIDELAQVISNDQALTAKVLRMVNSPLYSVSSVVTSIAHAVALLGQRGVRDLALGFAAAGVFDDFRDDGPLPGERLWEHSLGCGLLSKAVADRLHYRFPEEGFAAGLLHDVGKMVFNQSVSNSFAEALRRVQTEKEPLSTLEKKEIGFSHTEVGKLLLQKWNLPPTIVEAVLRHHDPVLANEADSPKINISLIAQVADILTRMACFGFGGEIHIHETEIDLLDRLPLEEDDYLKIISDVSKHIEETKELFGLDTHAVPARSDTEMSRVPRVVFFEGRDSGTLNPSRVTLRLFSEVESFPITGETGDTIDRTKPDLVFADLSSEQTTGTASEFLEICRNRTKSPIVFLLPKPISKEIEEKALKAGTTFLSTPFCPQALYFCLLDLNDGQNRGT